MISSREALCLNITSPQDIISSSFRILPLNCSCCLQACFPSSSAGLHVLHELAFEQQQQQQQPPQEASDCSSGRSSMCSSQQSRTPLVYTTTAVATADDDELYEEENTLSDRVAQPQMHALLQDSEGVRLFKHFLEQQNDGSSALLEFWFACQGFKNNVGSEENHKISQLIKVIYRTYIRGANKTARFSVSRETRHRISEKLAQKSTLDQSIFDEAQTEVEQLLRIYSYPAFIMSDIYLRYASADLTMTRTKCSSAVSPDKLSTLVDKCPSSAIVSTSSTTNIPATAPALTRHNLKMTRKERAASPAELRYHAATTAASAKGSGIFYAPSASILNNTVTSTGALTNANVEVATVSATALPNPYHISYAPAVSAQDSELQSLSSDALTDDAVSLTNSSVDGTVSCHDVAYVRNKQLRQQRRAMRLSALQNREMSAFGDAIIPPRPPPHLALRDVDAAMLLKQTNLAEQSPSEFTRILTDKLNLVIQDRANIQKMDALLIETEAISSTSSFSSTVARDLTILRAPWAGRLLAAAQAAQKQDAQTILEDHCGRIWEKSGDGTPEGCGARSPTFVQNFKRSKPPASVFSQDSGVVDGIGLVSTGNALAEHCFVHHYHYHHHHPKQQQQQRNATQLPMCDSCSDPDDPDHHFRQAVATAAASDVSSNVDSGVSLLYDQVKSPHSSSKVLAWMQNAQHQQHSTTATSQLGLQGYVAAAALDTPLQTPRQPASCDPGMEPLGTPHTTVQLEEAKRRLQAMTQAVAAAAQARALANPSKRCATTAPSNETIATDDVNAAVLTVAYYLCGDPVPYRSTWQGRHITLGQFKQLVAKKGCNYKFFFKRACNDFENGVVHQEITCEEEVLPLWEGKVFGKIEKVE